MRNIGAAMIASMLPPMVLKRPSAEEYTPGPSRRFKKIKSVARPSGSKLKRKAKEGRVGIKTRGY